MHELIGAHDGIHRAGANAARAADAPLFIDQCNGDTLHSFVFAGSEAIALMHSAMSPGPR